MQGYIIGFGLTQVHHFIYKAQQAVGVLFYMGKLVVQFGGFMPSQQ